MATFRQLHISYWQDPYIEDLKPLEKYFYIYLLTNSRTRQCGCYEISVKYIKYETGLQESDINNYMNKLQADNRIRYDSLTSEIIILKWLKHNTFGSPKVRACINKEVGLIKNESFKGYINLIVNENVSIDSLSIDYTNSIDTSTQKKRKEEEEENKNNNKNNKKQYADFVTMTEEEYQKLIDVHGQAFTDECITTLNNYKGANDKKYKSDYLAILNWVVEKVKAKQQQPQKHSSNVFMDIAREEGIM